MLRLPPKSPHNDCFQERGQLKSKLNRKQTQLDGESRLLDWASQEAETTWSWANHGLHPHPIAGSHGVLPIPEPIHLQIDRSGAYAEPPVKHPKEPPSMRESPEKTKNFGWPTSIRNFRSSVSEQLQSLRSAEAEKEHHKSINHGPTEKQPLKSPGKSTSTAQDWTRPRCFISCKRS